MMLSPAKSILANPLCNKQQYVTRDNSQPVLKAGKCCCCVNKKTFRPNVYLGIGALKTHVDPEKEANGWRTIDDMDAGYQALLGWHFKPHWFAELSYADLGDAGLGNRIDPGLGKESISYKVPSVHLGYWLREPGKHFNVYGKMGVSAISNEASNSIVPYEKQTNIQLSGGVGAQWKPAGSNLFVRAGLDIYDRDALAVGITVGYNFSDKR
jgi:hypothetical protein